ncbi:MAG: VanZ family protein [Bacteroidia bacterium]|nr:VanZ family protein [Bacteroidia bacterium]
MPRSAILGIAVLYTLALTVVSLITIKQVPDWGTDFDDKLNHVLAYLVLMIIWYFALNTGKNNRRILYIALGCMAYGIIIEAVQGKVNVTRVADSLDIVANLIGVLIGGIFSFRHNRM